jgi:hypothetical protein
VSGPGHAERSRQWLEEQLVLLGNLRNANPRDPSFKLWRQNTLTVLQRIWPGEQARSERFRRITFSPASARPDYRTTRDWYTRGCGEATELLHAMLTEIEAVGVPEPGSVAAEPPPPAIAREDDFPVLELPSSEATARAADVGDDLVLLDADGTAAAMAPGAGHPDEHDPAAPAPPKLRPSSRPPVAKPRAPEQAPPALPPRNAQSRPAPAASPESLPTMSAPPAPVKPSASAPVAPSQAAAPRAADRRAGSSDRRASSRRGAKPRRVATPPRLKDMLGLRDVGHSDADAVAAPPPAATPAPAPAPAEPIAAPAPPAAPAEPIAQAHAAAPAAGEDLARVTRNFMLNSPVLGLQGRPVQRTSDATQFLDPDAVALSTLASDVARYVSDEAAREPLRAALLELALQIEAKAPEWAALRSLVAAAMAHPELARRLMPLVLPWLGRAA